LIGVSIATTAVLVAGPLSASAVGIANPVCPQARANVGIPIVTANALDPDDHAVHVTIDSGSLPAGVELKGLARVTPYTFSGTPTKAGTSNFVVKAQFEDAEPIKVSCTIVVGELPTPSRTAGADRYEQAAKVSAGEFMQSDTVYVASGEKFADALSAGSVAGVKKAPLLLTPAATLPAVTVNEIVRLKPKNVVVVGGEASISKLVVDGITENLKSAGSTAKVTRIAGADRYEGSRLLIENAEFGVPSTTWSYVADGRNFPDALAATPPATKDGGAVLLVDGGKAAVSDAEMALLDGQGVTQIVIAGGVNSVSDGIKASLEADKKFGVTRIAGATRYDGAVELNKHAFTEEETAYLASGALFPDALSAGPVAGKTSSPIYLVEQNCVPTSVLDDLARVKAKKIVVLGGVNTLGADVAALKPC
jgi:putative cell wall-binding protein